MTLRTRIFLSIAASCATALAGEKVVTKDGVVNIQALSSGSARKGVIVDDSMTAGPARSVGQHDSSNGSSTPVEATPEQVIAADLAAQATGDWEAYLGLRSDLAGAPERVSSYRSLWQHGQTGIRGNVIAASLVGIKSIPFDFARRVIGSCCFADSLQNPQAYYAIVNYTVRHENKYLSNGPNGRIYLLGFIDGAWKIVQVSEPPVNTLVMYGLAFGSAEEQELLDRQRLRVSTGQFLNSHGDVVFSATPPSTIVAQAYPFPASITVAHFSAYPNCQYQYLIGCVDFVDYVRNVLPNEWISWWPSEALKAGAMAAKMVGWYRVYYAKYPNQGFDISDQNCDQVYVAGSAVSSTNDAVSAVAGVGFEQADGNLFYPSYSAGSYDASGFEGGSMYQNGTHYLADYYGYTYLDMVHYYYDYSYSTAYQAVDLYSYNESGTGCTATVTVSITSPCSAACTVTTATIAVSGTATDSGGSGLSYVFVDNPTANSSGFDYSVSGSSASYSVGNITLVPGQNIIDVQATDNAGHYSDVATAYVTYQPPQCYTLSAFGNPSNAGYPAINTPFNCNSSGYSNGTAISITAVPYSGYQFSSWSETNCNLASAGSASTTCTVTGSGNPTVTANFVPLSCSSFQITPGSASPSYPAGSQGVTITGLPAGCQGGAWSASGNGSWITVSPGNGSGSGSTTVFWGQNGLTSPRSGSATVAGNTFNVNQGGAPQPTCTSFQITPTSANPNSAAGSQSVTITGSPSGCTGGAWSASGNGSWTTVSPTGGSGSGSVTVFWGPNNGAQRSDLAFIAGNTFTVTQGAAPTHGFYTVVPCRLIDTRNPTGPYGGPSLTSAATRNVVVTGQCGIPAGATSVAVNVTTVLPLSTGWLTLFPGPPGTARPPSSTINYLTGKDLANNAVIPLGSDGSINVYNGGLPSVNFIIDVNGYFN